ncbi:zinc finger protein, putative [Entamoeba nuttalli P19]|uniref:RBR-type E3 ubiquitin transferase n=2 Tax=Entamoeba nuttalli TaxID=412467 RepID=K2G5S2_ENTNP|nr:zinc finger protein, putative [Entamoeba nuttalli P19]EKE37676.1 zinc finger protein, putative [Entamoeba nuttalli P19]|eukprot:XP_008859998.1 zinc finger protein, putative [Entamoeba nuttalli P19]
MTSYQKTNETGKCEMCNKEIRGFHHMYKCPSCGFGVCSDCLKKGPTCRCNHGIPPLTEEQERKMNILMEMGFPDYICIFALRKYKWNVEESIPWIIDNLRTFPKPENQENKREEEKDDKETDEGLEYVEDEMKWKEKVEEGGIIEKKRKGINNKRIKEEKEEEEWHEDVFDDELYGNGGNDRGDPRIEKCYEVIEAKDIIKMIRDSCEKESEALNISPGNVSILLKRYGWSKDKLEEAYFENYDKVCKENGIINEEIKECKEKTCPICYEEGRMISLNCGHYFCIKCWEERIKTMIESIGSNVVDCLCMEQGCTCKVNYEIIEKIGNKKIYERFMYFICKDFISHRKSYVFCPVDTCGRAIHYFDTSRNEVPIICKCGQKFCFKCGREMHKPVSCSEFMKWNDLVTNDTESMKFVNTISKPCFHCGLYTERVDGCNHMTCSRCHGEWCWMCRGDWKTHGSQTGGFYKCNLYEKSEAKKLDEQAQKLKEENKKFLEYFDEYIKYNNVIREITKQEDVLYNIEINIEKSTGKSNPEILEAAEVCKEAYSVIKYSFVFEFFIKEYEIIYKLFNFRQKKDIERVNELRETLKKIEETGRVDIQKIRQLIENVKKVTESLSDVSTENLMKNRFDEVKKKKRKN